MGNVSLPGTSPGRFPQRPESAAAARRFVRDALDGAAPDMLDVAQLLAGELVTNAVLYARTEVEVSARALDHGVRVEVTDHRPSRGPVPQKRRPHTGPGRGLAIVEQLADRYGVEAADEHKTVWFELWTGGSPPPFGWEPAVPPSKSATVTLVDLPDALYSASQQKRHELLRELTLAAAAGNHFGVRPGDLAAAHDVNNVISSRVTAALHEQPPGTDIHSLPLAMPADAMPAVLTLRRVLDLAEEASRNERLLTLPALPQNHAFRQWLLDEIIGQLAGGSPTAWTVIARKPSDSPSEPAPWDAGQVESSRVPTIAADTDNRIIAANGPAADMLGWEADELVGQRLTALIPEHLRERHMAAFTSLLLTGRPRILGRSVPLPALHRDGRTVPVRLVIRTQGTADGRTVFVAQLAPRTAPPAPPAHPYGRSRHEAREQPDEPDPTASPERTERPEAGRGGMSELERLALLADTGNALSSAPDLDERLRSVCRSLTRRLADWCVVDLLDESDQVERVCVHHRDPGGPPIEAYEGTLSAVTGSARGPLARVLRGAGPLLLDETPSPSEAGDPLDARHLELFEQLGAGSAVVAPLRARRVVFGALTVARSPGEPPFTEKEVSLVDSLARSIALSVDNARLYQETRHIAEQLQRSLLPVLPDLGHLQLAGRYVPSSAAVQVGGDWYDSFVVPSDGTALVIGDVTGSNLDAAVTMSQLRSMLRSIAVDRQESPGEILRRLDRTNHTLLQEATATCLYGLVKGPEGGPWELEYSSAGHLPPLLTTEEGHTRYLEEGAGLMLGVDPGLDRANARCPLPAGSTLLLYTDGLIERRDAPLSHGMDVLRRYAAALAREPLDVFCDELFIGLGAYSTDDIAILALRPTPPS